MIRLSPTGQDTAHGAPWGSVSLLPFPLATKTWMTLRPEPDTGTATLPKQTSQVPEGVKEWPSAELCAATDIWRRKLQGLKLRGCTSWVLFSHWNYLHDSFLQKLLWAASISIDPGQHRPSSCLSTWISGSVSEARFSPRCRAAISRD